MGVQNVMQPTGAGTGRADYEERRHFAGAQLCRSAAELINGSKVQQGKDAQPKDCHKVPIQGGQFGHDAAVLK